MDWQQYTYLALNLFTPAYPLVRSFEHRIRFVRFWPSIGLGILATALVFIPWDIWFTRAGVWRFNPDFLTGLYFLHLPLEEWLFFLTVPFACTFIYEVLRYFFPNFAFEGFHKSLIWFYVFFFALMAFSFPERLYTLVNFSVAAVVTFVHLLICGPRHYPHFHLAFLVSTVPFFLVNGVLTSFPVVIYDNAENLGIRIWTIPFEDFFYSYSMLLITVTVHEKTKAWFGQQETTAAS